MNGQWTVQRSADVVDCIEEQGEALQEAIDLDIKKLETRGVDARAPLVKHFKWKIYYLVTNVNHVGAFRIYYVRTGERSFYAFHAYKKAGQKMPRNEKQTVIRKYKQLMEAE